MVISSGRFAAVNKDPAMREAKLLPVKVSTGTPIHKASFAVVPALNGKVSKNKSARKYFAR